MRCLDFRFILIWIFSRSLATMLEGLFDRTGYFSQIPRAEAFESLTVNSDEYENSRRPSNPPLSQYYTIPLFILTVVISALFGAWLGNLHPVNLDVFCTEQVSQYCQFSARSVSLPSTTDRNPSTIDARRRHFL